MIFLLRWLVGGLIIATVPLVGNKFGSLAGGVVVLMPVSTLLSLSSSWWDDGPLKAGSIALATVYLVPLVAVPPLVFALAASRDVRLTSAVVVSFLAWLMPAALVVLISRSDS